MKKCCNPFFSEKGYVLVGVYFMTTVLSIFSLALFSRGFLFSQHSERNQNRVVAFNMADTGVHHSMRQLSSDMNYSGTTAYTPVGTKGGFESWVCPPSCPNGVTAPVDPMVRLVQTAGYSPSNVATVRAYETRPVIAYVEMDHTPFEFAALGDDSLTVNGNPLVDSYNTNDGVYGGSNVGSNGDVASDGPMTFPGTPNINGDIVANPKFNCSPAATTLTSLGDLDIRGNQNIQLPAGTYRYDSINITGNGKLTLLGPVTIYVDGEVYVGGNGIATSGNKPINFMLYGTGSEDIDIAGTSEFHAAIYAPAANVHYSGTQDFYGAVIAKNFDHSGAADLHYDEALKDVEAPCTRVSLLSWRERNIVVQS
jgi:hypothetical protein